MGLLRSSPIVALALLVVGGTAYVLLLGCGGAAKKPATGATVFKVHGGGFGKGIFIVSPKLNDAAREQCRVQVQARGGSEGSVLSCESEYVVSCDVTTPANKPFCKLVREDSADRFSLYPTPRGDGAPEEPPASTQAPPSEPAAPAAPAANNSVGELIITSNPVGANITVDGAPVGAATIKVSVVAGDHTVEATWSDGATKSTVGRVTAGRTSVVKIEK